MSRRDGSTPMIRGDEQVRAWVEGFPELDGRPELLREITRSGRRAKSFRRALFKKLDMLYQVPFIPDTGTAQTALRLIYQHCKVDLLHYWEGRVSDAALCQAVSCLKDRRRRMEREIRRGPGKAG